VTTRHEPWLRLLAGAAFALLAAGVLAPMPARAECGDYVKSMAGPHAPLSDQLPAAPTKVCHGPGCSALPVAPPMSRAVPITVSTDWATAARVVAVEPDPLAAAVAERGADESTDHASSIFHPPRLRG
jgi:hypothetical protein